MKFAQLIVGFLCCIVALGCSDRVVGVYETSIQNEPATLVINSDSTYEYFISFHGRPFAGSFGRWKHFDRFIKLSDPDSILTMSREPSLAHIEHFYVDSISVAKRVFQVFSVDRDTIVVIGSQIRINGEHEGLIDEKPYVIPQSVNFVDVFFVGIRLRCIFDSASNANFYRFYFRLNIGPPYSQFRRPPFHTLTYKKSRLKAGLFTFERVE